MTTLFTFQIITPIIYSDTYATNSSHIYGIPVIPEHEQLLNGFQSCNSHQIKACLKLKGKLPFFSCVQISTTAVISKLLKFIYYLKTRSEIIWLN